MSLAVEYSGEAGTAVTTIATPTTIRSYAMASPPFGAVTLIFDGRCGFCTRSVGWLTRLDRAGRVEALASQQPGLTERFGLTPDDVAGAVWAFDGRGRRYRGAGAVNAALSAALGRSLPVLIYRLPVIRQIQDSAYAFVARHRSRFPGVRSWCEDHPGACSG